jgi:hypothetical protein
METRTNIAPSSASVAIRKPRIASVDLSMAHTNSAATTQ